MVPGSSNQCFGGVDDEVTPLGILGDLVQLVLELLWAGTKEVHVISIRRVWDVVLDLLCWW